MESTNAKWFELNTDCLLLDPTAEVWSCEDCPCAGCKAASAVMDDRKLFGISTCDTEDCIGHGCIACFRAAQDALFSDAVEDWFYASCLQGDDLPQVPAEFGPDVDLIALEVMADRLAGHRTSYLLA